MKELQFLGGTLSRFAGLLREEVLVDVGQNTTLGDSDMSEKFVQFLIVTDCELEMTGNNTGLLVVTGGVSSQLKNLSREILEDGSKVDGSTGTNTLSIVALPQETVNTTDGKSETGFRRTALTGFSASSLSSFTSGRHCDEWFVGNLKKFGTGEVYFG